MLRNTFLAASICCVASTVALADFSYDQNTQITGGAMAGMMKLAGAFSKAAREPTTSSLMVKGDRLAHITGKHISITDLKSETVTEIDPVKKTYSVVTFADMVKAMQRASEKMSEKMSQKMPEKGDADKPDINFKASVKDTGEKKVISGLNTKKMILTIEMGATDQKSGTKGAMTVVSDMWLAPRIPGYDEIRDFYKRMGTKLAWTPGSNAMGIQSGDMMNGMNQLAKEAAKLDGVPILQIMKMGVTGDGTTLPQSDHTEKPKQAAPPAPTASEAAVSAIAGRFGLGGLSKKKKTTEEQPASTPSSPSTSSDSAGSLMEMTIESSNFSTAAVDSARFEVPAGYKKVDSQMEKALR